MRHLGPQAEEGFLGGLEGERALRQSLIISDAGIGIFFMRPISAVLMVIALAAVAVPLLKWGQTLLRQNNSGSGS